MCLEYVLGVCEIYTSRCVYNMKLPYGRYALNYVLHLCTLYKRNRLSRAASLTVQYFLNAYVCSFLFKLSNSDSKLVSCDLFTSRSVNYNWHQTYKKKMINVPESYPGRFFSPVGFTEDAPFCAKRTSTGGERYSSLKLFVYTIVFTVVVK